jgi:hypothetical protein
MVERFLFYGIGVDGDRAAVDETAQLAVDILSGPAFSAAAREDDALPGAEKAFNEILGMGMGDFRQVLFCIVTLAAITTG